MGGDTDGHPFFFFLAAQPGCSHFGNILVLAWLLVLISRGFDESVASFRREHET